MHIGIDIFDMESSKLCSWWLVKEGRILWIVICFLSRRGCLHQMSMDFCIVPSFLGGMLFLQLVRFVATLISMGG
jgi:hypothetical protein